MENNGVVIKQQVNTKIDAKLFQVAKENNVSWQIALVHGIYEQLLEKDAIDIAEIPIDFGWYNKEIRRLKLSKVELAKRLLELEEKNSNDILGDLNRGELEDGKSVNDVLKREE